MRVIVVGAGKVGYYLAQTLMEHEHKPYVIEPDKELCRKVANNLDIPVINGDGTTVAALESAGVEYCDAFVSATGRDEVNLIACQLAKKRYGVGRTVARVNNPRNLEVMKRLGVDIPVSSTDHIARLIEREIDAATFKQLLAINHGEAVISEVEIPKSYRRSGVTLSALDLPKESVIVSITRDGKLIIPRGDSQIMAGDKVITICRNEYVHELRKSLYLE